MTQKNPFETQASPANAESIDEEWFATGERASTPPPRSTRRPLRPSSANALRTPSTPPPPPADPIGDTVADDWFR